jgi:hypothetical protein
MHRFIPWRMHSVYMQGDRQWEASWWQWRDHVWRDRHREF